MTLHDARVAGGEDALPEDQPPTVANRTLRLRVWQAPTILNPHLSTGAKDSFAARCCLEPLITIDELDTLVPVLASAVPSRENGGLSPDGRSVTYTLEPGVMWADGRPFTAEDVAFTFGFISDPAIQATSRGIYDQVDRVEVVDQLTVRIWFKEPTAGWMVPFVGGNGQILPRHAFEQFAGASVRNAPFNLKPFGTGPFRVDAFAADAIAYSANPFYREPGKPYFRRIELVGGGDAAQAARAVLQTGECDYAWNLLVEPPLLTELVAAGAGDVLTAPGLGVEAVFLNQADPNVEIDGERSHPSARHPFLTDPVVREAMALALDRRAIAEQLYGPAGDPTSNFLTVPANLASPNTTWKLDLARANDLLDTAGYRRGADGVRVSPGGARLHVLCATSATALRQREQEMVQAGWAQIGIETELRAIPAASFFGTDAANPDTFQHFYADVQILAFNVASPFPGPYMRRFLAQDPARDWAQKANQWTGSNFQKWRDPAYDQTYAEAATELDPDRSRALWRRLNDIVVNSQIVIPLVDRRIVSGKAKTLKGPRLGAFDTQTWNVGDWSR